MAKGYGLERLEQRRMLASVSVAPLPAGHSVEHAVVIGDVLYYGVFDGSDRENITSVLWRSDGTAAGTRPVRDAATGDNIGVELGGRLVTLGEKLLVLERDNRELWSVDYYSGLATHLFSGNTIDGAPSSIVMNDVLYFTGYGGAEGAELWRSDGTAAGTHLVTDLGASVYSNTGAGTAPRDLTVSGGKLFFTADVGTWARELYVSDGTADGTSVVMNLIPNSYNGKFPEVSPQGLAAAGGGRVVFTTPGYKSGGIWSSDGTAAGTILLARGGGHGFVSTGGGRVVYKGEGAGGVFDYALWGTDGTPAGTLQLYDPPTEISSMPLITWNGKAYLPREFRGGPQYIGTDGTVAGTTVGTLPFMSGLAGFHSWPQRFAAGMVFTAESDPAAGRNLYATGADGVGNQLLIPKVEEALAAYSRVYYFTKTGDDWTLNAYAPNAGTLAGKVFDDANANGVRDEGERGLVGHKVFIDRNGDGVCNKNELWTRTTSTGSYHFHLLPAGLYTVRVVGIGGQRASTPEGFRVRVPDEGRVTRYFGRTVKGGVTGTVYLDANRNGTMDSNERGLSAFTVYADRDDDAVLDPGEANAATDAQGFFELVTLDAGNQTLRVTGSDLGSYEFVKPAGGAWRPVVVAGEIVANFHFGLARITSSEPAPGFSAVAPSRDAPAECGHGTFIHRQE